MKENKNPMGNIYVSHRAIATIAYQSAVESYGVVGLAAKNFAENLTQVLVKDPTLGVEVKYDGQKIEIDESKIYNGKAVDSKRGPNSDSTQWVDP